MDKKTFSFAEMVVDLDAGVFEQQVSAALMKTAEAVVYQDGDDKAGKVVLEFKIERIGNSHQVQMHHKLAFTVPTRRGKSSEEGTTSTALYVGKGGTLSIMPDNQVDLFTHTKEKN